MPLNLPLEAYRRTERTREWERAIKEDTTLTRYGLAGTAYAKARKLAVHMAEARDWQEANAPTSEVFPVGATPIPDMDRREPASLGQYVAGEHFMLTKLT
jgi:hypothetical protein